MSLTNDLSDAAVAGDLKIVKYLVEKGANVHYHYEYPLRCAAFNGHLEVVKYLVEKGADISVYDHSALKLALAYGWFNIALYLKSIYSQVYGEKFLCHNCLVLAVCGELCSSTLVK
jgi:ankyrin repeat protein